MPRRRFLLALLFGAMASLLALTWPTPPRWRFPEAPGWPVGFTLDSRVLLATTGGVDRLGQSAGPARLHRLDVATGRLLDTFPLPDHTLKFLTTASLDGRAVLLKSFRPGATILDATTGKVIAQVDGQRPGGGEIWPGTLSNHGRYVTTEYFLTPGGRGRDGHQLREVATGRIVGEWPAGLHADCRLHVNDDESQFVRICVPMRANAKWIGPLPRAAVELFALPSGELVQRFELPATHDWWPWQSWHGPRLVIHSQQLATPTGDQQADAWTLDPPVGVASLRREPAWDYLRHKNGVSVSGDVGAHWRAQYEYVPLNRVEQVWQHARQRIQGGSFVPSSGHQRITLLDLATGRPLPGRMVTIPNNAYLAPDGQCVANYDVNGHVALWETTELRRWPLALALGVVPLLVVMLLRRAKA